MKKKVNDKYYLYVQHSKDQGISIIDISNPAQPKAVGIIPWPDPAVSSRMNLTGDLAIIAESEALATRNSSNGGASNQCSTGTPALGCGIVYKMTPNAQGKFTETILYRFQGFADGATPEDDRLVIDASGNIFGTTAEGGNSTACPADGFGTPGGCGVVFEVTP